jgi:hypothetical protein
MQGEKTAIVLENILCVIFAASESWNVWTFVILTRLNNADIQTFQEYLHVYLENTHTESQ